MENNITIREAVSEGDISLFWQQLHSYFKRDIFPDPKSEDLEYFLDQDYRNHMTAINRRQPDKGYFLFFQRDGRDIGFAMPVVFSSEDGKCFIMEFCIYPEFRGGGTGTRCAEALLAWAETQGSLYAELNYGGNEMRRRFWQRLGFRENGADEWGEPLMLLPPKEEQPFTAELLRDPEDWQLLKLMNGYKAEIGEPCLSEEQQEALQKAVLEGRITFFVARRGYRAVGICSVAKSFSTYRCAQVASLEDFYVEPVFRKKGIARLLTDAAKNYCRENGISSLSVTCAPCDEEMYRSLGFAASLGTTLAHILE